MSAAKHTPRAWTKVAGIDGCFSIRASDIEICEVFCWTDAVAESEANADLIASAPETAAERDRLRASNVELVGMLRKAEFEMTYPLLNGRRSESFSDMLELIRNLIAKAEPEASHAE